MELTGAVEEAMGRSLSLIDLAAARHPIDFTPSLDSLLRAAHREVDSMMDRLTDNALGPAELRAQIAEVERLKRRVEAVQLRLTAQASQRRAHEGSGQLDTPSWFARTTRTDRADAAGHAALADALGGRPKGDGESRDEGTSAGAGGDHDPGGDAAGGAGGASDGDGGRRTPHLTATGAALDEGRISAAHAKVIMRALDTLPDATTDEQRRQCELALLELCTNRSPSQVRRAARRIIEVFESRVETVDQHEDDLVADEEEAARDKASFWIKDNRDGTMTGQFTVPWVSGMMLKKVIDAMTAPRRRSEDATAAGSAPTDGDRSLVTSHADRHLDWAHRRGLALADLLTRIPTDHLHTKVSATMLVTTRLSDLLGDLGTRAAGTDVHDVVSAGTARRLACGAGILPAVLDGDSVPLDLGRQRRLFSDNQRMALAGRYDECAAEGCDRPFAWTETHHLKPWEAGGLTDLDNAVPLCGRHHHMIDSGMWSHSITRRDQRTVALSFHRRT